MIRNFKQGRKLFQSLIICLISSGFWTSCLAQGTIYVSGTYTGKTTWDADTVKVTGTVSVDTLFIEPGTVVEFQGRYGLNINKYLDAHGELGDTILFTVKDTTGFSDPNVLTGGWGGIAGNAKIKLRYCRIQFVKWPKTSTRSGAVIQLYLPIDIQHCCITNNMANGIYLDGGKLNISNSSITNNTRLGILGQQSVQLNIQSCIVRNNTEGGIFSHLDGDIFVDSSTIESNGNYGLRASEPYSFYLNNTSIQNNNGNGIMVHDLETRWRGVVSNSIIKFNNGNGFQGDICGIHFVNNLIFGNKKAGVSQAMGFGAGTIFINNTIVKNSIGIEIIDAPLYMYNCICKYNIQQNISSRSQVYVGSQSSKIYNSDIQGINTENFSGEFINNIDEDPRFVDTANFDFHLKDGSPCIDAGTIDTTGLFLPQTDIEGNPRIINRLIDIGAYEGLSEIAGNQPPLIEPVHDQAIIPGATIMFKVLYVDPDPEDEPAVLSVTSDIPEIQVKNVVDNVTSVNFSIVYIPGLQTKGEIQIQVIDNQGNIGLQKFQVFASNEVCGAILENTVWDTDTIKVACDVTISDYVTLTIKPGTVVAFANNCRITGSGLITGSGSIVAIGNKDSLITFTSYDTTGFHNKTYKGWKGIKFTGKGKAQFRYCNFLYAVGSALDLSNDDKLITNCQFYNNSSDGYGGAVFLVDLIQPLKQSGMSEFNNNIFCNNRAKYGGAIYYASYYDISINNNLFCNNQAESGGAILSKYGTIQLINNTIVGNKAQLSGGGANIRHGKIINCIIWGNESGIFKDQVTIQESGIVSNCIIEGGASGIKSMGSAPVISGPILSNDPAFVNKTSFDFHLTDTSAGINSGTTDTTGLNLPDYDLDGNPRVSDGRIDIGAFEHQKDNFQLLKQPVSQVICAGAAVCLETEAVGGVVGYQWQKNGADIPSANQRTLTFDTVSINDAGYYNCIIIAHDITVSTDTITLSVDTGLTIESQSSSFSICPGKDTLLYVTVCGSCRRNYTWSKNDTILPDATESRLIIHAPAIQQQDIYFCTVSNACGTVGSENITVTASNIPDPPVSYDTAICEGQPVPDLNASGTNIEWYSDAELTNPVYSGSNFKTGNSKHGLYTYYVTQTVSGCESNAGLVELAINVLPEISLGEDSTISTNENMMLGPYPNSYSYLWNNNSENPYLEISGNDLGTGSHTLSVMVTDSNACQNSDTMIVNVEPYTNLSSTRNNNLLHIFPNPTSGLLDIEISDFQDEEIMVKLFNQQGQEIFSNIIHIENGGGTIQLNLTSHPAGIYYLQIITNSRSYFGKVIRQ